MSHRRRQHRCHARSASGIHARRLAALVRAREEARAVARMRLRTRRVFVHLTHQARRRPDGAHCLHAARLHALDHRAFVQGMVVALRRVLPLLEPASRGIADAALAALGSVTGEMMYVEYRVWNRRLGVSWGGEVPISQRLAWLAIQHQCTDAWLGRPHWRGVRVAAAALAASRGGEPNPDSPAWRAGIERAYARQLAKSWRAILRSPAPAYRPSPEQIRDAPPIDAVGWDQVADMRPFTLGELSEAARRAPDLRANDSVAFAVAIRRGVGPGDRAR
ncbi:MAG: hypothetical protein AAF602_11020 [Myxococcota bacterium]